ncbi:MAG TPA: protein YrbN, partial [Enterobacteriaceae bacterium]|nr:protein YrbN [Enterobacteriaceae bacterium]
MKIANYFHDELCRLA